MCKGIVIFCFYKFLNTSYMDPTDKLSQNYIKLYFEHVENKLYDNLSVGFKC